MSLYVNRKTLTLLYRFPPDSADFITSVDNLYNKISGYSPNYVTLQLVACHIRGIDSCHIDHLLDTILSEKFINLEFKTRLDMRSCYLDRFCCEKLIDAILFNLSFSDLQIENNPGAISSLFFDKSFRRQTLIDIYREVKGRGFQPFLNRTTRNDNLSCIDCKDAIVTINSIPIIELNNETNICDLINIIKRNCIENNIAPDEIVELSLYKISLNRFELNILLNEFIQYLSKLWTLNLNNIYITDEILIDLDKRLENHVCLENIVNLSGFLTIDILNAFYNKFGKRKILEKLIYLSEKFLNSNHIKTIDYSNISEIIEHHNHYYRAISQEK